MYINCKCPFSIVLKKNNDFENFKHLLMSTVKKIYLLISTITMTLIGGGYFIYTSGSVPTSYDDLEDDSVPFPLEEFTQPSSQQITQWMAEDQIMLENLDEGYFDGFDIEYVGPVNAGGRTTGILIDRCNSNRIFAGSTTSGLFLSEDAGENWTAINSTAENLEVSSIVQSPFDCNIIYYGSSSKKGILDYNASGIYKSTDGGNNFLLIETPFSTSDELLHSPMDPETIYSNSDNGLWQSIDGGITWTNINPADNSTNRDAMILPSGQIVISGYGQIISFQPNNPLDITEHTGIADLSFFATSITYCKNAPNN